MNSFIDELFKQQRMAEQLLGGGALKKMMDDLDTAKKLTELGGVKKMMDDLGAAKKLTDLAGGSIAKRMLDDLDTAKKLNDYYKQLPISKSLLDDWQGSSTQRRIEQMRENTSLARVAHDAMYGYAALAEAHKALTRMPWGVGSALHTMMSNIDGAALRATRQFDALSSVNAMMREVEATRRMLSGPAWAAVTGETLQSFQADLIDRYSENSLYREVHRVMEAMEAAKNATAEAEADSIFAAIKSFLLKHSKKLTVHNLAAVFDVVFLICFHLYLTHHFEEFIKGEVAAHIKASKEETVKEVNAHTFAVADALLLKFEKEMAALAVLQEAQSVVKWAVGSSRVNVRVAAEHGSRIVGQLLPDQVVIEFDHQGQWIQVEFIDHKAGVPKLGWVLKKHLTRVTPRKQPHAH